ncbi:MAG: hypothetical protein PCFJNLEI_01191 [Verrucomicrobiae bacterium]|nr:hypothetical protein [Verrucomicrobiae bacterium]
MKLLTIIIMAATLALSIGCGKKDEHQGHDHRPGETHDAHDHKPGDKH